MLHGNHYSPWHYSVKLRWLGAHSAMSSAVVVLNSYSSCLYSIMRKGGLNTRAWVAPMPSRLQMSYVHQIFMLCCSDTWDAPSLGTICSPAMPLGAALHLSVLSANSSELEAICWGRPCAAWNEEAC
jgi:hypothetical protein